MTQDNNDGIGKDGLVGALERLSPGSEPPMRDLVPDAIVQGHRIIRRRRIGTVLGSTVAVLVLAGGAMTLPSLTDVLRLDRTPHPAAPPTPSADPDAMPGSRYPTVEMLRTVTSSDSLEIEQVSPADPPVPGRYFRVRTPLTPEGFLLYAAVFPTVTTSPAEGSAAKAGSCTNLAGQLITTLWDSYAKCEQPTEMWKNDHELLTYSVVGAQATNTGTNTRTGTVAHGATFLAKSGWTVQVVAGDLDRLSAGTPAGTAAEAPTTESGDLVSSGAEAAAESAGAARATGTLGPVPANGIGAESPVLSDEETVLITTQITTLVSDLATNSELLGLVLEKSD
jgi:hypothetical protein